MKIGENIEALPLRMVMGQNTMILNPVVLWDGDEATLVDTGMVGQYDDLKASLKEAGVEPANVKRIILTHQDIDHVGNLPQFLKEFPQTQVWAHKADKPYIEGQKDMIKMSQERLKQMPIEAREQIESFLDSLTFVKVTKELEDGEMLDIHGGVEVIFTPGHTPGHISLFVKKEQLLITGDAMNADEGVLKGPRADVTPDMEKALASVQKTKTHEPEYILCYHGGHIGPKAYEQLNKLV